MAANPPKRIALKVGDWLPHKNNLYVSSCADEETVGGATHVVRMDVLDAEGAVIRQEQKAAERGRLEFLGVEYKPGQWTSCFSSDGLKPREVTIRPAPYAPGLMFGASQ